MKCRYCETEKDDSEFYKQSRQKCKSCTKVSMNKRYYDKYKKERSAGRLEVRMERLLQHPVEHPTTTGAERAYAAGLIDGEGCVSILQRGRRGGRAFRAGQYTVLVFVSNTSEPMIRWLLARWGGHAQYVAAMPEKNRKEQWRWQLQANRALLLLDDIYPFLLVKRPQAKLARRFQRYLQVSGRRRTDKLERLHRIFWIEVRRLNHRGFRPFDAQTDAP